jgi:hypothetical protein
MSEMHRNENDPLGVLERESVADQLLAQRELIALEQWLLERMMGPPGPAIDPVTFGAGGAAEQTLDGDPRDPFVGVAILNPSPATPVFIGFAPGGALNPGRALMVPPQSYLVLPVRYAALSLAVVGMDPNAQPFTAWAVRLRVPPLGVHSGPYGVSPLSALADTQTLASSVVAPGGAVAIANLTPLTPGLYTADITTFQPSTPDGANANMQLLEGGSIVGSLPSTPNPITTHVPRLTVPSSNPRILVRSNAAAGAGAVYFASIIATRIG